MVQWLHRHHHERIAWIHQYSSTARSHHYFHYHIFARLEHVQFSLQEEGVLQAVRRIYSSQKAREQMGDTAGKTLVHQC